MKLRSIPILLPILMAGVAYSQPIISSVTGEFENGNDISISGSFFGVNGPNVILFDDFEGGENGSAILTGPGSAEVGEWNLEEGNTEYSNFASLSGNLAFRADMEAHWLNYAEVLLPANTMDVFVSWWLFLPSEDNFPGQDINDINWKQMWLQGEGSADDDQVLPSLGPSSWILFGNNTPYVTYPNVPYLEKGEWKRFSCWIKGGYNNDGEVKLWHLGHTGDLDLVTSDTSVSTMFSGGKRERVRVNGYGRATSDSHPTFDDVYVAAGPSAQARIELGNHPVYENCSNVSILVPLAWSEFNVTAKLYTGSFYAGPAFIFVVDSSGSVSQGYPIQLGGQVEPGAPGPPGQPTL